MPPSTSPPTYEVQLDLYIARRKRMHAIFDPDGVPVYHAPLVIPILDWLANMDVTNARFTDDKTVYQVEFCRVMNDNPNSGD